MAEHLGLQVDLLYVTTIHGVKKYSNEKKCFATGT